MSVFEHVTGFAGRHFSDKQLQSLRRAYMQTRTKLYPLMRLAYGSFNSADLKQHLESRIGDEFEILMVHSSVNNMMPMYDDTPLDLVKMLLDICAPDKTLVMPAFYFGEPGTRGARDTFLESPEFNIRRVPSQMGLATEMFRRTKGVMCSRHPVYRCAAHGPLAEELVAGHETALTACGVGTPFDFMTNRRTKIVGMGKTIDVLTHVHHAEAIMGDDFPVRRSLGKPLQMTLVDRDARIPFELQGGDIQGRRNMWKLEQIMRPVDLLQWTFHRVPFFATDAKTVTDSICSAARNGLTIYD